MATPEEFAQSCKQAARSMRRLPADLRRALGNDVRDTVAEPLAADIRHAWTGPHARVLSAATKARVQTDPRIVIGGSRRVVSGGANPRQLVFGNEWGGSRRSAVVKGGPRRGPYRRRVTQQFPRQGQHAVYGTIHATLDRTFDRWVEAVEKIVDKVVPRG